MAISKEGARQRRELLAKGSLFSKLSESELDTLVQVSRVKKLRAREELFHKGDPGSQVYLISKGRLKVITTSAEGDDVVFSIMAPGEVFGELVSLSRVHGLQTPEGIRIDLKLSQAEIGDLVATTRESVNKQMKTWSKEGLVSMKRGIVTIHRVDDLEALAGFAGD